MNCNADIRCFEICVFCRDSFTWLRKYIRHKCGARKRGSGQAKEFYRKERCAQLRRSASRSLDAMLPKHENHSHEHLGKRTHETADESSHSHQPFKKHMSSAGTKAARTLQAKDNQLSDEPFHAPPGPADRWIEPRSNMAISVQRTTMPSFSPHLNRSMTQSGLSDIQFPSYLYSHSIEGSSGLTPGEMFAPIFDDFTIPPYYQTASLLPPQMFSFASNTVHEGQEAFKSLETSSDGIVPVRDPERHGEFDSQ